MDNDEIKKKIYFAETVIGTINHVKCPMLMYEEEKNVVKEALGDYISKLEIELRDRYWKNDTCIVDDITISLETDKVQFGKEE